MKEMNFTITNSEGTETTYSSIPPDTAPETPVDIPTAHVFCDGNMYSGDNIPTICNTETTADTTETTAEVGVTPKETLPITGNETIPLSITAVVLLAAGATAKRVSRR